MVAFSPVVLTDDNFKENAIMYLKGIWTSREFADVTLVSGDGTKFQAHKTVLSSSSTFFRDILLDNNENQRVMLFLKGVKAKELELLLEFIYTGVCQVIKITNITNTMINIFLIIYIGGFKACLKISMAMMYQKNIPS